MNTPRAAWALAGEREQGSRCPSCAGMIRTGDPVSICQACGTVRHHACWLRNSDCCAFAASPLHPAPRPARCEVLRITHEDLEQAVPLPTRLSVGAPSFMPPPRQGPRRNPLAVSAFVVALAGIPFFGLLTGLVAVVLGCLALGSMQAGESAAAEAFSPPGRKARESDLVLAVVGVVLGLVDVVGWLILLYYVFSQPFILAAASLSAAVG